MIILEMESWKTNLGIQVHWKIYLKMELAIFHLLRMVPHTCVSESVRESLETDLWLGSQHAAPWKGLPGIVHCHFPKVLSLCASMFGCAKRLALVKRENFFFILPELK